MTIAIGIADRTEFVDVGVVIGDADSAAVDGGVGVGNALGARIGLPSLVSRSNCSLPLSGCLHK